MKLRIKRLTATATLPRYMTDGAAGMDLYADENDAQILPGETREICTGISIAVPASFEAQVRTRSGLAVDGISVANSPGTVDSDYRGEIRVLLHNRNDFTWMVDRGDRIAQLVIAPVVRAELVEVDELNETARGAGGFGSTGTK